jgi:hypothetical protein
MGHPTKKRGADFVVVLVGMLVAAMVVSGSVDAV